MSISMAGSGPSSPQMNVTPLIDVLLVLIIIFMVVVNLEQTSGEKAMIPQSSTEQSTPGPDPTVVIQIVWTANNSDPILKINQQEVSWADLQERLHKIYDARVERVAFIKGDADIDFQYVAQVIDVAHHVGVERVGLLGKGQGEDTVN